MPYIKDKDKAGAIKAPSTAGELNFAFTDLIQNYLSNNLNYQAINDIVGALEGAKAEFQRRVVAPYEDIKIKENGDCYLPEFLSLLEKTSSSKTIQNYLGLKEEDIEYSKLLEENETYLDTKDTKDTKDLEDDFDTKCG